MPNKSVMFFGRNNKMGGCWVDVIYLDFKKAFDKVPSIALYKYTIKLFLYMLYFSESFQV